MMTGAMTVRAASIARTGVVPVMRREDGHDHALLHARGMGVGVPSKVSKAIEPCGDRGGIAFRAAVKDDWRCFPERNDRLYIFGAGRGPDSRWSDVPIPMS